MENKQALLFNEFGLFDFQVDMEEPVYTQENDNTSLSGPSSSKNASYWFEDDTSKPFFEEEHHGTMECESLLDITADDLRGGSHLSPRKECGMSESPSQPIFDQLSDETPAQDSRKIKKREENTILRVVMTTIRDHLKSKGFVKRVQGDAQLLQKLPGTKPGIEQLFSYLELNSETRDFKESLLGHRHELRKKGLVYHSDKPERETSFYEHFDLVFEALEVSKNYKERLNMIFKSRSHTKQLQ